MSKRGGLGRGLSALIPGAPEAGEGSRRPAGGSRECRDAQSEAAPDPLGRGGDQGARRLDPEVGILQPIVVRRSGEDGYELVAGERRLRAAKVAGLATVPVVLRDTEDADLLREALIENIHRQDLGPIELAEAFRQLLEDLGLKQEELADRVGVSRSHIANTIRLLQLPLETQQLLTDARIQAGHARALLALGDADAVNTLALRVAAEDLSVRETEDLVRRYLEPPPEAEAPTDVATTPATDAGMAEVEEILSEQLATRVQIQYGKKRGRVIIEFGSVDDLERIVSEIVGSGPGLSPD